MNLPKTICILPWVSIETSPIGTARPCCLAIEEITNTLGEKYSLKETTIEEIYHSDYMINLRKSFLDGNKPETCQRCWNEEAAGRTSKRINSRIRLKEFYGNVDWHNLNPDQLWFIDLKLGNICNLKCRICGSWSSSKWAKEEIDYIPGIDRKTHLAYKFLQDGAWPRESQIFWDNLKQLLPNIKYFEFTGGEPFLIEQHFALLEDAISQGFAKNIEIHYNTNGTVFPEKFYLWENFKSVEVAFSIDNIGKRFEYERYGAKWNTVQENLKKFFQLRSKNFTIQLCITVNIQNILYLPEICDWAQGQNFDNIYFNVLHDPWCMSIGRMTETAKVLVKNKLGNLDNLRYKNEILRILQFIQNGLGSDGKEFVRKMKQTDEYRGQNFAETHPEIATAMGYGTS